MNNPVSLEEALNRITELEKENAKLTEELDYYKKRPPHVYTTACKGVISSLTQYILNFFAFLWR